MEINKGDLESIYETLLKKVLNEIRIHFEKNLISVVLYGSMARGEITKDSDIDLLIISDNLPKERSRRQEMFMEMEKELDKEIKKIYEKWGCYPYISPILKTKDDARNLSPLYLDMVTDAKILYDKNDFFKNVLEKLRLELKSLNARKITVGKKWYWDLKPDYKFGEVIKIG